MRRCLASLGLLLFLLPSAARPDEKITYSRIERDDIFKRLAKAQPGNQTRYIELKRLFIRSGCTADELSEQAVEGAGNGNLICRLQGETDRVILVTAHYDAQPDTQGVVDNWSGAALLPTLYQSLYSRVRKHTIIFIAFSGGVNGHAGAAHYTKALSKEDVSQITAAISLDSLGLSFTRGWSARNDKLLIGYLKGVSSTVKLPVETEDFKEATRGMQPFSKRRIPAITIHSLSKYNHEVAGSPEDTIEAIKENEYYESYMVIASYLALLDQKLE
jgi:Iap family predicted aminopeptidase